MQQDIKNKGKSFTSISRLENGIQLHYFAKQKEVTLAPPLADQRVPGSGPCAHRQPFPQPKASPSLQTKEGCSLCLSQAHSVTEFWCLCIVFPCWHLMGVLVAQIENAAYSSSVSQALRWRVVKGEAPRAHCTNLVLHSNLQDEE